MGKKNSWVIIEGLEPAEIKSMYNTLHFPVAKKKFFEAPIYCQPLRLLTPQKPKDLNLANGSKVSKIGLQSKTEVTKMVSKVKLSLQMISC